MDNSTPSPVDTNIDLDVITPVKQSAPPQGAPTAPDLSVPPDFPLQPITSPPPQPNVASPIPPADMAAAIAASQPTQPAPLSQTPRPITPQPVPPQAPSTPATNPLFEDPDQVKLVGSR